MRQGVKAGALLVLLLFLTSCGGGSIAADGPASLEAEKRVALTFDDGPKRDTTERLLDALKARGVPATFFLIGEQLEGHEDLVRRMQAEGHQVGIHTWSHIDLSALSPWEVQQELSKTQTALAEILGPGHYWLRPPYGRLKASSELETPIIIWSVDPRDWESKDADAVTEHILSHVQPGDIVLLHDIYDSSVDAAIRVVDALQAQGYRFVTVEELLGPSVEPGVRYTKASE